MIFVGREQPALAVVPEMLAHDASFTAQREDDGDYRASEDRHHDEAVNKVEAVETGKRRAIPSEMEKHGRQQSHNRHQELNRLVA